MCVHTQLYTVDLDIKKSMKYFEVPNTPGLRYSVRYLIPIIEIVAHAHIGFYAHFIIIEIVDEIYTRAQN